MRSPTLVTAAFAAILSCGTTAKAEGPTALVAEEEWRLVQDPPRWKARERVSQGVGATGAALAMVVAPVLGAVALLSTNRAVSDGFLDATIACVGVGVPLAIGGAIGYGNARQHAAAVGDAPRVTVAPVVTKSAGGLALRASF
jgi:hypothetical protein